jgi:hypothetical protein
VIDQHTRQNNPLLSFLPSCSSNLRPLIQTKLIHKSGYGKFHRCWNAEQRPRNPGSSCFRLPPQLFPFRCYLSFAVPRYSPPPPLRCHVSGESASQPRVSLSRRVGNFFCDSNHSHKLEQIFEPSDIVGSAVWIFRSNPQERSDQ